MLPYDPVRHHLVRDMGLSTLTGGTHMSRKPEKPSAKKAEAKPARKAEYQGGSPKQIAEALLRYRPAEQGPKTKGKRWL